MVTKNWYSVMKAYRAQMTLSGAVRDIYGTTRDVSYYSYTDVIPTLTIRPNKGLFLTSDSSSSSYAWIVVGSGTTPATVDDYKMQSQITSGLSATQEISVDEDNNPICKLTLTNASSEDITIGEVGIIGPCVRTNSTSYKQLVLLERTVLDNPITIPAGGFGVIDYCIKIPIPTA